MKKVICAVLALLFIALPTINVMASPSVETPSPHYIWWHTKKAEPAQEEEVKTVKVVTIHKEGWPDTKVPFKIPTVVTEVTEGKAQTQPAGAGSVVVSTPEELPKTASAFQG